MCFRKIVEWVHFSDSSRIAMNAHTGLASRRRKYCFSFCRLFSPYHCSFFFSFSLVCASEWVCLWACFNVIPLCTNNRYETKRPKMCCLTAAWKLGKDQVMDNCSGLLKKQKFVAVWKNFLWKACLLAPVVTSANNLRIYFTVCFIMSSVNWDSTGGIQNLKPNEIWCPQKRACALKFQVWDQCMWIPPPVADCAKVPKLTQTELGLINFLPVRMAFQNMTLPSMQLEESRIQIEWSQVCLSVGSFGELCVTDILWSLWGQ